MPRTRTLPRLRLGIAFLLPLAIACGGDGGAPTEAAADPQPTGPPPGDHVGATPDGNRMPYSVAGRADAEATVVMVHCWMCNRTFWDAQLPVLGARWRTLTLDLPGHGEASAERAAWTVAGYGDDVAGLIRALDLGAVVLVGHSMGGPVSLRAAAQLPGTVRGIVAVDTLHDADFRFEGEQVEGFVRAFESDFAGTCAGFVDQMLPEEGVEAIADKVRQDGCVDGRSAVGIALMHDFRTIDMPAWFRQAGVPIRAINAAQPNPTRVETNRGYADFEAGLVDGVGHYLHMTRPETVNPLLVAAVAELAAAGG